MTAQKPRVNPAVTSGGEGCPAPVIPGCTRVERQITARGASADELEALGLPRYAMLPVVVYQAIQYDQDDNVLAATTTVVPSQHPNPEGWEVSPRGGE
ncbi:hypothetical protein ACFWFU_04315 [Streptomyces sp. NPDC060235]|uniref:hypothetical protein n=1 Tax=Streptomyces sp. NPDC060235 TaxID=3347080 RepID=UPI00364D8B23